VSIAIVKLNLSLRLRCSSVRDGPLHSEVLQDFRNDRR